MIALHQAYCHNNEFKELFEGSSLDRMFLGYLMSAPD